MNEKPSPVALALTGCLVYLYVRLSALLLANGDPGVFGHLVALLAALHGMLYWLGRLRRRGQIASPAIMDVGQLGSVLLICAVVLDAGTVLVRTFS